jgi:hypothetical protein
MSKLLTKILISAKPFIAGRAGYGFIRAVVATVKNT